MELTEQKINEIRNRFIEEKKLVESNGHIMSPAAFEALVNEYESYHAISNEFDKDDMDDAIREAEGLQNLSERSADAVLIRLSISVVKDFFTDPRAQGKVIYPIYAVVLVILIARARGIKKSAEIAWFYAKYNIILQVLIPGLPSPSNHISASTINCIRAMVSAKEMEEFFTCFFGTMKLSLGDLITYNDEKYKHDREGLMPTYGFDGQELRSSFRKGSNSRAKKGAIAVTLMNCTSRTACAFINTHAKNQERTAFIEMAEQVDLKEKVIMCDALNSAQEVTSLIVSKGGFYLAPLKDCQGNKELKGHVEAIFNRNHARAETSEFTFKDHGRIENYYIEVLEAAPYLDKRIKNPHQNICSLVKFTKHCINSGSSETRVYVSNLEYVSGETLRQVRANIIDYWMIETHHNVIDTSVLAQDSFQACNPNTLSMEVAMNKAVYNMCTCLRNELSLSKGKSTPVSYSFTLNRMSSMRVSRLFEYVIRNYFMNNYEPTKA